MFQMGLSLLSVSFLKFLSFYFYEMMEDVDMRTGSSCTCLCDDLAVSNQVPWKPHYIDIMIFSLPLAISPAKCRPTPTRETGNPVPAHLGGFQLVTAGRKISLIY